MSMLPPGIDGFVGWETVYDLNDHTDLEDWDAPTGDGIFELTDGVIRQTNESASHPVITLPTRPLLDGVVGQFPMGLAWQADVRITRALASGEFGLVDGYEFGIEFVDDGTVDDDSGGDSAPVVVGQWYTARVVVAFAASGAVVGITTNLNPFVGDGTDGVGTLFTQRKVRIDLQVGTEPIEVRNVKVYALVAHDL